MNTEGDKTMYDGAKEVYERTMSTYNNDELKLWLLRPRYSGSNDPWEPWYDKCFGMVVRAESEEKARQIAAKESSCEEEEAWLNSKYSSCEELTAYGDEEVIIKDEHWA